MMEATKLSIVLFIFFTIAAVFVFQVNADSKTYSRRSNTAGIKSAPAKTTRVWNCCKASCSWGDKAPVSAPVKSCAKNGETVLDVNAKNGCDEGGSSFLCNDQIPFVKNGKAYGFAAAAIIGQGENQTCCACYELTFTSGEVKDQKMTVQVHNPEPDNGENHFSLFLPGAVLGSIKQGCASQWGTWGKPGQDEVKEISGCDAIPNKKLRECCRFRFGWFKNADNPSATFKVVKCPKILTDRTGCVRTN